MSSTTPPKVTKEIQISHNGQIFTFQVSLVAEGGTPPQPGPQPTDVLKIVKVTTSADDGNKGENMLNADASRWSCQGTNCVATFDLGGIQDVQQVIIRFHKGAERTENFEVSLSDNAATWASITGSQEQQASAVLTINPAIKARYVRFTGKGNNVNDWNSIEYVEIKGKKITEPIPEPQECPPGQHRDPTTGQCVPDTVPPEPQPQPEPEPPATGIIEDGVKMFYPKIGEAKKFTYGSSNEGRAQWSTDNGKCMVNQEVTAVLHLKKITNMGEEASLKLRGGRHSSSNPKEGSCYIIGVTYDGNCNKQWEEPHPSNHQFPGHEDPGNFNVGSLQGKKIAIKAICYLQGDHDHLECWLDTDPVKADGTFNNNYRLFWEHDTKEFTGKCNGNRTLIRCDDIEGAPKNPQAELLYGSTREITIPSVQGAAMVTGRTLEEEHNASELWKSSHVIRSKDTDDDDDNKEALTAREAAKTVSEEAKDPKDRRQAKETLRARS